MATESKENAEYLGEKYYCPYCDPNQTKWEPHVLEPHWTVHANNHIVQGNDLATESVDDLIEELAAIEHDRWAKWQSYVHDSGILDNKGNLVIPFEHYEQWRRQIITPYSKLSEVEKQSDRDEVKRYLSIVDAYYTRECARKMLEAEQKPVGAALEIKVAPETMKAVMARIRLSDKSIADRVLEPLWRVQRWRDGSADEYDLEIEQWKLRILAHLTRRFNWAAFLLKPDNLKVLKTRAELRAAIQEVGGGDESS